MTLTQTLKIHIWVPDYESATGGIQVFSRFLVRAIADCFPDGQITVLSKNDSSFPVLPTHKSPIMFDCTGWWAPSRRTAAYTSQLIKYGLRDRPDLIFCGHVNFSPVARWLKRIAGIPFIAIGHGLDVWNIRREGVRRAVPVADRTLAVSHFTANSMTKAFGLRRDQIGLLPNTFDSETFVPGLKPHYLLKRFRLAPQQPVILTVARLAGEEQYKGYDQVLRALPAVRRAVPQVHYILGGKGPDKQRLEELVRDLRLEDVVTFAGYIPDHELCGFYNLCDVFAMPSKAEGFGIVFLEALACGKPVIAGNQDGSVDAVLNGKLGVLVNPDNVVEIAETLIRVLTKRHPLGILQDPERLRAEAIAAYGYPRFVETLAAHLARFGFSPKVLPTDQAEASMQRFLRHRGPDDEGLFLGPDGDADLVPARVNPRIHIWVPDYESATGGIQVFSRFLVRAIADCFPDGQITVLSKNDSSFPVLPTHKSPIMFDCTGWWAPSRRTAAYTSQLIKYGLRDRPDLIFCGHVNFSPVARWLKRIAGIPFIAIGYGLDVWNIRREGVRRAVPIADRALAISHFTADSMTKAFGLRHDQIGLLPTTFDPEIFVPGLKPHYLLKRFRLAPEQPVILTVARLAGEERYKGYDQVLRALPAVRRAVPQVRYILGGKGPDKPRIEALIRDLRLEDVVTLAGYIPGHELCGFYNLCDVFAMPSKAEGFGIVFLEALACGKPVIAGNQDGSVDAVLNGKLGVLVNPDNVVEIAETLIRVLTKRHPLGILQDPERLRAEAIAAYGYPRFVETLAAHLARFGFSPKVLPTDYGEASHTN